MKWQDNLLLEGNSANMALRAQYQLAMYAVHLSAGHSICAAGALRLPPSSNTSSLPPVLSHCIPASTTGKIALQIATWAVSLAPYFET
jgi:hypothetical protein